MSKAILQIIECKRACENATVCIYHRDCKPTMLGLNDYIITPGLCFEMDRAGQNVLCCYDYEEVQVNVDKS